ncbi:MAG: hypothetical protein IKS12_04380 [Eubacterium sp.]|nr:hypothetical protein [Eubacterium sp.]
MFILSIFTAPFNYFENAFQKAQCMTTSYIVLFFILMTSSAFILLQSFRPCSILNKAFCR